MKIETMEFFRTTSPLTRPIADATHTISEISFYVVRLRLRSGVVGEAYLLSFHYSRHAIEGALRDLEPLVRGKDCNQIGIFMKEAQHEQEYFGHDGIHKNALGVVNVALWDALGKSLGQPIWKLFGTTATRVPIYGSGGWLSYSTEELIEEVLGYKARGFKAVKIKVGTPEEHGGVEADLERLRLVRETVGSDLKIMMDANQGMNIPDAIALSNQAKELNILWFEEPVVHTDFEGLAFLRQKTGISIATGEREYSVRPLQALIQKNAIDLWQPDLIRMGGVEAWRESASYANVHHIPVLPHYYKDYDVPLLCTIPNGFGAESFDWIDPIIDNQMVIKNGFAYPRDRPGWGFSFRDEHLQEVR
ncbi:mandelate racemase/muconate lactonizing enzyme family protein [Rhodobacteraceae bacterium RKSG542]|uniref:mandelate racemase/muconate lactonizing enzyme family protein n=1 Tax=Pseudovibrio flavus TaxID=2529854 RepID=UPI0012BBB18E|nr:mandelate racemase/muconate lactonizing enzyme family protein [Pseudovibrio flavus]MTI18139.1 mandelate racemase/muconate lactonizing enzyme family protein [Pseudovibrio flavus]